MPREIVRQADFSFGELSDGYAATNAEAKSRSLKKGLNLRITNSYGVKQRFGSLRRATLSGNGIVFEVVITGSVKLLGFLRAGGVDIYTLEGALLQSVSGGPWTVSDIGGITWHVRQNEVYFAHQSYWPRILSYADGAWSLQLFDFSSGAGNSSQQPYHRFAPRGVSLLPSARTGDISVEFSADVLTQDHVGVRFRYGATISSAKELQITAVTDARHATATVIDTLPPTFAVVVADASGYRVGEEVEGQDSQASGIITLIDGVTVYVLMGDNYTSFDAATNEYLVGPNHRSKVASLSEVDPAETTVWDEAALSPARGYPGDVFERSGRLGFADFAQIPCGIALSAPGSPSVFNAGAGEDQDAIFYVLEEGGQRIRYCVSAANLTIITDRKCYYVPESDNSVLSAANFVPIEVGPIGASSAFPVTVDQGVAFVESGGNRVMGLLATGDLTSPFSLQDLSKHSDHLIKTPVSLAMTTGSAQAPERYIFALNSEDGSLTCMFYDTNPPRLGLTPWETDGEWLSMAAIDGIIYAVCRRTIAGATAYLLERLDAEAQMDASSLFSLAGTYLPLTTDSGEALQDDSGNSILTDLAAIPQLAGQTVKLIRGTEYLGEFEVQADGSIEGIDAATGDFEAGLHFDTNMVLWPPEAQQDDRTMFARRRVSHVAVRVEQSGSYTVGLEGRSQVNVRPPYDQNDSVEEAPPLRSEVKRWALAGYDYEPCIQIQRPLPVPLNILSVAQEVVVTR